MVARVRRGVWRGTDLQLFELPDFSLGRPPFGNVKLTELGNGPLATSEPASTPNPGWRKLYRPVPLLPTARAAIGSFGRAHAPLGSSLFHPKATLVKPLPSTPRAALHADDTADGVETSPVLLLAHLYKV